MNPEQLRELADALNTIGYARWARPRAAAYLRSQADAMEQGAVAYINHHGLPDGDILSWQPESVPTPSTALYLHPAPQSVPEGWRLVRFIGVDPLNLTGGAVQPMLRDSWRFAFTARDDGTLEFGFRDDGPLVAHEAVEHQSSPEGYWLAPMEPPEEWQGPSYFTGVNWPTRKAIYRAMRDAYIASPAAPAEGAQQWTGIARAEQIADEASEDYVFEGDAGTYTPTDGERFMLLDFAMGLLADDEFVSAIRGTACAGVVRGIDPMQDPMRPTTFIAGAADEHPAEQVLRSLASWLGVGGYNAPTVDADEFHRKIVDGVEMAILSAKAAPAEGAMANWQPVPPRACIQPTHEAADAFWRYWRENGETHKHGYYESTWGAINAALAVGWSAAPAAPAPTPCIGGNPTCPCQDGDICHYRDSADGTPGWPIPAPADAVESLLRVALEALEYHTEQTRPIQRTEAAILAIRYALAAADQNAA